MPRGGTAVDISANQGVYLYALADIADLVVAFEPNPDYAFFARWMLRGRAEVHKVALSKLRPWDFACPTFRSGRGSPSCREPEANTLSVSQ